MYKKNAKKFFLLLDAVVVRPPLLAGRCLFEKPCSVFG